MNRDTIGHGMMCGDVMMNSFMFSRDVRVGLMCPLSHGFTCKSELFQI